MSSNKTIKARTEQVAARIVNPPAAHPLDHDEHLIFSLRSVQQEFQCKKEDAHLVMGALQRASEQTWTELTTRAHDKGGMEFLPIEKMLRNWPASLGEPPERVAVLRFSQRGRIIGMRRARVFHIVWIDPLHEIYKG